MGEVANNYHYHYGAGKRDVISSLRAEEANLLHARRLARLHGWWRPMIGTMQGLHVLYAQTGRRAEWARLVEEITADVVDPATDGALPGREELFGPVTQYRVLLAEEKRQWREAERLQRLHIDWDRRRAEETVHRAAHRRRAADQMPAPAAQPPETTALTGRLRQVAGHLTDYERNTIHALSASLHELGEIQRERQEPACVKAYQESLDLLELIGERAGAAVCAFNLGHAYKDLPEIRDLDQAERWYGRSVELHAALDALGRGRCSCQLGAVALERFKEARSAWRAGSELANHLNAALESYQQALSLLPEDAVADLGVTHGGLGAVYAQAGDMERALPHFREAIRYDEIQGNVYGAGLTRFNVGVVLARSGRLADAREYALAAVRDYQTFGDAAAEMIEKAQQLLAHIEKLGGSS